jgi:hypothetical protein
MAGQARGAEPARPSIKQPAAKRAFGARN